METCREGTKGQDKMTKKSTGLNLDFLARTEAWKSLGKTLQEIMIVALVQRDLAAALRTVYPNWNEPTIRRVVIDLLKSDAVRHVIELYAVGVSDEPAKVAAETPTVTESPAEFPAVVTIDCGMFDAAPETEASL
jgi:hypothetical protein